MVKIIDGKNATMGRLASYVAKQALKGDEFIIVNCDKVIITGNRENIREEFQATRDRVGTGQGGQKISRLPERIVKHTIRGMLPNYRTGRGREAFKRIKCYSGIPKEYEAVKKIQAGKEKTSKFIEVVDIFK